MRLWHYKLIPVLPKKMLIAQWRECIAIKRQWEKGTLKHRLVSYVMNYDKEIFLGYVQLVMDEMEKRKIRYHLELYGELAEFCLTGHNTCLFIPYPEHNDRYLLQCICNLEEKHDREIIDDYEWSEIEKYANSFVKDLVEKRLEKMENE